MSTHKGGSISRGGEGFVQHRLNHDPTKHETGRRPARAGLLVFRGDPHGSNKRAVDTIYTLVPQHTVLSRCIETWAGPVAS